MPNNRRQRGAGDLPSAPARPARPPRRAQVCRTATVLPSFRSRLPIAAPFTADRREVVHQLLVDVVDDRIAAIDLLCSRFIETARPGGGA